MINQKLQLLNAVVTEETTVMPNLSTVRHWFFSVVFKVRRRKPIFLYANKMFSTFTML